MCDASSSSKQLVDDASDHVEWTSNDTSSSSSVTTCWQPDLHVLTDDRPAS